MTDILTKLRDRALFRMKAFGQVPRRLYDELDYIHDNGGAEVLLLVSDLVRHLKSQGIHTSPGYGFTPCSLLCYGLGITDVDPMKWGLPFERFTRSFCQKNALWIETGTGGFEKAMEFLNCRCDYPVTLNPGNHLIVDIVFLDDPKFFTLHLGIAHNESLDILKILSASRTISPWNIDLDKKTLKIFIDGDTGDISGFSNMEQTRLIREFHPECFSDICLISSLYRPQALELIPELTRRKNENDVPSSGLSAADSVLMESYGALVYQEQAIQIEKILLRADENEAVQKLRKLAGMPFNSLYPKGHAIARTMMGVELAYYKSRVPSYYREVIEYLKK